MAIYITDDCTNSGACEPECPNNAIYEGGAKWTMGEGTSIREPYKLGNGKLVAPDAEQAPVSQEWYYIAPDKCTECVGFHEEPQCAAVCPVEACVLDPDHVEGKSLLTARWNNLHASH